jgi:DnaJ-class molecular chaperone
VEVEKKIKVKIPQGIENGAMLRIKGEGEPGFRGQNGDLYVVVTIEVPKKLSSKQKKLYEELLKLESGFFGKVF